MEAKAINIRCFSRKDSELLEKVLEKAMQGSRILKVSRMGATLYVHLEPRGLRNSSALAQ